MNNIAILPYITLHALQIQNVKRNTVKKVSINELNNEVIYTDDTNSSDTNININKSVATVDEKLEVTTNDTTNISNLSSTIPVPASLDNNNIGSEIT